MKERKYIDATDFGRSFVPHTKRPYRKLFSLDLRPLNNITDKNK